MADQQDDSIRRVPAIALEPIVEAMAAKVLGTAGDDGSAVSTRALIGRVEVHSSSVQLVIRTRAIPGKPTMRAAMESLRERLDPGEQVLIDPSHAGLIRVVLPIRLVVRGGRTWITGADGRPGPAVVVADPRMVKGLRAGHRVLKTCGIDPGSLDPSAWRHAKAPQSGRDRQLARLALLAPDLQRAMLSGEVTNPLDGGGWSNVPLSWAAQREMFAARAAAAVRQSTS